MCRKIDNTSDEVDEELLGLFYTVFESEKWFKHIGKQFDNFF